MSERRLLLLNDHCRHLACRRQAFMLNVCLGPKTQALRPSRQHGTKKPTECFSQDEQKEGRLMKWPAKDLRAPIGLVDRELCPGDERRLELPEVQGVQRD